jgi:hypothetical protein
MAKRLTQEAIDKILNNVDLYASVAKILKVKPAGLPMTLSRNGNKVNNINNIEAIAKAMGKKPSEIVKEELAKAI